MNKHNNNYNLVHYFTSIKGTYYCVVNIVLKHLPNEHSYDLMCDDSLTEYSLYQYSVHHPCGWDLSLVVQMHYNGDIYFLKINLHYMNYCVRYTLHNSKRNTNYFMSCRYLKYTKILIYLYEQYLTLLVVVWFSLPNCSLCGVRTIFQLPTYNYIFPFSLCIIIDYPMLKHYKVT